jgi:hypothetical protein
VVSTLVWYVMSHWHFCGSILPSCLCGESCLLVSWCVGGRCSMVGSDEDCGRSTRPGVEDRRWSSIGRTLGGQAIRRSGDTVCILHYAQEDEECEFLSWASKPRSTVYQWFDLKTTGTVFSVLASKPMVMVFSSLAWKLVVMVSPGLASKLVAWVSWYGPQNWWLRFGDLGLKITVTVS